MQAHVAPAQRSDEHFTLYQRYLGARHAGAGMDNPAPEDFDQFLRSRWSQTRFLELRRGKRLLAVAVTDELPQALSAVYTFRSEEHTSELQSLMRISYAVFCLKKKKHTKKHITKSQ